MESLEKTTIIWEGRFQPIQKGHISYIRRLLSYGSPVWIYLVDNELSIDVPETQSPVPQFTKVVDHHHKSVKNPLAFWIRYQLLTATLRGEFGDRPDLFVWGGRRMDLHWSYVSSALPPRRRFLLSRKDEFEDAKAAAFGALGETVERIEDLDGPDFRATDFRAAVRSNAPIDEFLSPHTMRALEEMQLVEEFYSCMQESFSR